MSAPRITAAVGDPGIPRVTSGSREPTSALDAADSGATTPSSAPVPNFSGFLANFFARPYPTKDAGRSEEHTSELQSQSNLVCRLLLEKKTNQTSVIPTSHQDLTTAPSSLLLSTAPYASGARQHQPHATS